MRKFILFIYAAFSSFCSVTALSDATRFNAAEALPGQLDVSGVTFIEANNDCRGNRLKCGNITFESGPTYIGGTRCLRTSNWNVVKLLFSEEEINNLDAVMTLAYSPPLDWHSSADTLAERNTDPLKSQILKALESVDLSSFQNKMRGIAQQLQRNAENRIYTYCKQMSSFYHYIQFSGDQLERLPQWNIRESDMGQTFSATHTEFIMVYKILQELSNRRRSLLNMNSISDFNGALNALSGKLPRKIYSAKAMCPVCEAFLTSLYKACGCEGVFISKWNDYDSPSGPEGPLQKVYIGDSKKEGTQVISPDGPSGKPSGSTTDI